jgi:hypothetical protein
MIKKINGITYLVKEIRPLENGMAVRTEDVFSPISINQIEHDIKVIEVNRGENSRTEFVFYVPNGEPFYREDLNKSLESTDRFEEEEAFEALKKNLKEVISQSFKDNSVFIYFYSEHEEIAPFDL